MPDSLPGGPTPAPPGRLAAPALEQVAGARRAPSFVAATAFALGVCIGRRRLAVIGLNLAQHLARASDDPEHAVVLVAWTLRRPMTDRELLQGWEGIDAAVVSLTSIHAALSRADAGGSHIDGHSNFAYVRLPETDAVGALHWMTDHAGDWVSGLEEVPHPHLAWPAGARHFHFRRAVDNDGGEACRWLPLRTASCRRDSAGAPSGRPSALGHDDATASAPACLHPRPRG